MNQTFNLISDAINPQIYSKIIEYFIENRIDGSTFSNIPQNKFVNDLAIYLGDKTVSNTVLQLLHQTVASYTDHHIEQCEICHYINTMPSSISSVTLHCNGCGSMIRDGQDSSESKMRIQDIGRRILEFVESRSGKPFDDTVFTDLVSFIEKNEKGLIKIRNDDYSTDLVNKDYDMILKSFICFISTIHCQYKDCYHSKTKLLCQCDDEFKLFTYSLILSINALKSANDDSLLANLSMRPRSIHAISRLFFKELPDKLKADHETYCTIYEKYIIEWVSFELYNFKCRECGHINKSILMDRMFEYTINLTHCRLCHHKRVLTDESVVDLDDIVHNKQRLSHDDILRAYYIHPNDDSDDVKDDGLMVKYENGISMRYTVLRPKYGSLAEELILNEIRGLSKNEWDQYLQKAKALHYKAQHDTNCAAISKENNKDYGISKHDLIGVNHLIVVLIYTEKIYYAQQFSRAYWYWKNEDLFCNNFYWFGRYLYEAVHFFGERMDHNRFKIKPLQHALSVPMVFDSFAPNIHFPAATNNNKNVVMRKAAIRGCILSYIPKYIGDIDDTKCVSTSRWSQYKNHEWLFMGSSKLQISSVILNDNDFVQYNRAMLYLEKIFTQTIFDQYHYNTMNNALYLPEIRAIAFKLIQHRAKIAPYAIPPYIDKILSRWCQKKTFITLETYPSETRFMSNGLRVFLIDPTTQRLHTDNIKLLFPNLKQYRDVNKTIMIQSTDSIKSPTFERVISDVDYPIPQRMDPEAPLSPTDILSWQCSHCCYNNIPLMVNSLWRYYNQMNECALCGIHRYLKVDTILENPDTSNDSKQEPMIEIFKSKLDKIKHGFDCNAECLIGNEKQHIIKLSCQQFVFLLEHRINVHKIDSANKKQLITANKPHIISYFRTKNIDGKKFYEIYQVKSEQKKIKEEIISHCNNNRKLFGALNSLFQLIIDFDLKASQNEDDEKTADNTIRYEQLLKYCPAMKRVNFIVQHFEQLTSQVMKLGDNGKYRHNMRRVLESLKYEGSKIFTNYDLVTLHDDFEHIMEHKAIDNIDCEQKEPMDCIHFKRSRRDEHQYRDINLKRKLFNCDNANDWIYIDMLDRIHTSLKHSMDVNVNHKKIKDDVRSSKVKFSIGVYMEYHSLEPLYQNLYREVTHNQSYNIAVHQFKTELDSVKQIMKTKSKILRRTSWKTDTKYGITKGDMIRIEHILCLNFYCNFGKLCTAFRKSYRKVDYTEPNHIVIARHTANFYWFGRFLTNAVEFFGDQATDKEEIYTGIADVCLFDHFSSVYEMPTSTTWDKNVANQFTESIGIVLKLSPKFKHQINASRYLDVSKTSDFEWEHEKLFAGMAVMAITNIYTKSDDGQHINYRKYVQGILYLERIIEQTIHTKELYNHSVITKETKNDWMEIQKQYLVPLLEHQMERNLSPYQVQLKDIGYKKYSEDKRNDIPIYVYQLFEHFCDNKTRHFIDFSCIMFEFDTMDQLLRNILFKSNPMKNQTIEINEDHIAAIFPNVKQFKNQYDQWISLPSFQTIFAHVETEKNNEEQKDEGIIETIDRHLSIYYKISGRDDYFAQHGVGKFQYHCNDIGFEDDDVIEELDTNDAQESMLTELDDNFPIHAQIADTVKLNEFIFGIILRCKQYDMFDDFVYSPTYEDTWAVTHEFFNVSDVAAKETHQQYEKQCKLLWDSGLKTDKALKKVIEIGYKHGFPYIEYLVDMFMRDKIAYKLEKDSILTVTCWAQSNYYMRRVEQLSVKYYDMLLAAIKSFCSSRVLPQINLQPAYLIQYSIENVADYFLQMCHVVFHINHEYVQTNTVCPWQMDFTIIFKDSVAAYDDDDYDDDDEDETNEARNVYATEQKATDDVMMDVGDIEHILDENGVSYYPIKGYDDENDKINSRTFTVFFKNFTDYRQRIGSSGPLVVNKEGDLYPHRERFCILIDQRNKKKTGDIYFFSPPHEHSKIPTPEVPEWYFESSKQYLLPRLATIKDKKIAITTQTKCSGKMMTFSFHVVNKDEIKIYLYYDGGLMRFFINDIIDVLPLFFVKTYQDEHNLEHITKMVRGFKVLDSKFERFLVFAANK